MSRSWTRRVKKWPSWLLLAFIAVFLLAIGIQRDSGPSTPQERVESISRQLACPTCDGESVAESRGTASQAIRQEIARLVADGQLTDSQVVQAIDDKYSEELQLKPGTSGLESVIWALPIAVAVSAGAGLAMAFRRWQTMEEQAVTHEDRQLVAQALAETEASPTTSTELMRTIGIFDDES
jgi:cytochrome c-type biogenesis protein CcmH